MVMRIIKKSSMWVLLIVYLALVFGFVSGRYDKQLCNKINVEIVDSASLGFLTTNDIISAINQSGLAYLGVQLRKVDLPALEKTIRRNQIIRSCKVYTGINGVLNVEVSQREPFVRIIDSDDVGYYLDHEGNVLKLSPRYAPRVLVVNGHIQTPFAVGNAVNIHTLGNKPSERKLQEIFELTSFITQNELWNAQIEQVYVDKSGEFELVPRVGPHLILLGGIENYREKFKKLEIFYRQGLNHVGWNQYIKINLKYKDQVVCTKI